MNTTSSTKMNILSVLVLVLILPATSAASGTHKNCLVNQQTRTINCSNLGIETVNKFSQSDEFVHELYLSRNQVTSLEGDTFDALRNLLFLDLSINKLRVLASGLFNALTNLRALNLQKNRLASISKGQFNALKQLEELDLTRNQLTSIPEGLFNSLKKLRLLGINSNKIEKLDGDIFKSTHNLQKLYVGNNPLKALILGIFDNLVKMTVLSVTRNTLTYLPVGIYDSLQNVQQLSVTFNEMSVLQVPVFDTLDNVEQLYLYGNPLVTVDYSMFDHMTKMKKLLLPPICNCTENKLSMMPFLETVKYNVEILINGKDARSKWVDLTKKCKPTNRRIDHPYCDRFKEEIATKTSAVTKTTKGQAMTTPITTGAVQEQEWSEWKILVDCSESCWQEVQVLTRSRYVQCFGDYTSEVKTLDCPLKNCSTRIRDDWYERMKSNEHLKTEREEELAAIRKELIVEKSTTTAAIRRRTSTRDHRTSSTVMGGVAAIVVFIPFMFAICSDVCSCARVPLNDRKGLRKRKTITPS